MTIFYTRVAISSVRAKIQPIESPLSVFVIYELRTAYIAIVGVITRLSLFSILFFVLSPLPYFYIGSFEK